ncbi:L-ornithine 5-monooxygenase [Talaromyces proteolyticus]|uniref:L-ornithine N(5)-monooxygenase n=1 Tax=Talaromyces proteolyticus TaxID=1131652 RepID=A0AAD4KIM0_9EURO|nr:L-ornithine 5-monooxygenase [Talaromyces proteolyticus]KAH8689375.1 L-ornithine 5-monooxygenase [Talaromyces proteolyticus]
MEQLHDKQQQVDTSSEDKSRLSQKSQQYEIICIGFGPAALAIAIAMHDRGLTNKNILFLERQNEFGWHTGMLLPGTKMQISFMKDLATMRNPQSYFTFANYLHKHDRLANFINLSTHTPFREEFNDYMKWCASHFGNRVCYGQEVVKVTPSKTISPNQAVESFWVTIRDVASGNIQHLNAKHVIVANGGEMSIPEGLSNSQLSDRVIHSSQYLKIVPNKFRDESSQCRFAVVGGGQSAVEIAEDLQSRYPRSHVTLVFRDSALRPSDDSPFVNEIFDPASVDEFYSLKLADRKQNLIRNKATNYSVVRMHLIEGIYEKLYRQKLLKPDPRDWTLTLMPNTEVTSAVYSEASSNHPLKLQLKNTVTGINSITQDGFDLIVAATGYVRNPFMGILEDLAPLLLPGSQKKGNLVQRNYRLLFQPGSVVRDAGVWLQGSCEGSHGISDSLLSILAIRADEILDSLLSCEKSVENRARL